MAKNRNKKRNGLAAMDVSTDQTVTDAQAMDTSESAAPAMEAAAGEGVSRYVGEDGEGSLQVPIFNLSQRLSPSNPLNLSFSTRFDNPRKSQANFG
ncbi:hypothetical protein KY285_006999 [Solanum tuberosum]|nr:hypothetical protein KY285_006999 [Solanum tuberosum]